jgi:hypothetical protein
MKKEKININITLDKDTEIFNPYNKEQLSDNLNNYIYNSCKGNSNNKNIKINILHSHNLNEEEKKEIIDAIRSNFGTDIKENILHIQYELSIEIILILIGTILLVTSKFFHLLDTIIIDEVISIFGWVMIWEAAYHFIFVDIKEMIQNKRLKKLTEAKINFKQIKD